MTASQAITVLQTALQALTLDDGTSPAFVDVLIDVNEVEAQSLNNLPIALISMGDRNTDGENPTLGTSAIFVDIWTRCLESRFAQKQFQGTRGIEEIHRNAIEKIGNLAGPNLPAALTYISSTTPEELFGGNPVSYLWHLRMTYTLIRG